MDLKEILKNLKLNESLISILFGGVVLVLVTILFFTQAREGVTPNSPSTPTIGDVSNDIEAPVTDEVNDNENSYTVAAGDSLWTIAEREYGSGFEWVKIASANPDVDPDFLNEGDRLVIPADGEITDDAASTDTSDSSEPTEAPAEDHSHPETYTVVRGDSLWNIAVEIYGDGYRWSEIAELNQLVNPSIIHAGNQLQLPN